MSGQNEVRGLTEWPFSELSNRAVGTHHSSALSSPKAVWGWGRVLAGFIMVTRALLRGSYGPGEIGAALAFPNHPRGAATYKDKLMLKEAHLYGYPSFEVMGSQVSRGIWSIREPGVLI